MEEMGKHQNNSAKQSPKKANKQPMKGKKKPMKVTYISSPLLVKACNESEFREIVQELTGKDSNVCGQEEFCMTTVGEAIEQLGDRHEFGTTAENNKNNSIALEDNVGDMFFNNIMPSAEVNKGGFVWMENSETLPGFQSRCFFV